MSLKTQVVGRLIEPVISGAPSWHSQPFKFRDLFDIPVELPDTEEATYIITCWDSNIYIRVHDNKTFDILDTYGSELTTDKEYIIIKPSY